MCSSLGPKAAALVKLQIFGQVQCNWRVLLGGLAGLLPFFRGVAFGTSELFIAMCDNSQSVGFHAEAKRDRIFVVVIDGGTEKV